MGNETVADLRAGRKRPVAQDVDATGLSNDMLGLLERQGMGGFWSWRFEDDLHFWSDGCFELLGFDRDDTSPSYGRLMRVVHADDRSSMPRLADLLRGEPIPSRTIQIVRDDGTTRIVDLVFELRIGNGGRSVSACGLILDVTDREWLNRSRASAVRRRRTLDSHAGIIRFTMGPGPAFDFVPDAARVLGRTLGEVNDDPFAMLGPEEGAAIHELLLRHRTDGRALVRELTMSRPDAPDVPVLLVMVPVVDERGGIDVWDGIIQVRGRPDLASHDPKVDPIVRLATGSDFTAARAILGWSRQRLADTGDMSLSTIRRVEEEDGTSSARARARMVDALRQGGARFHVTADGSIAVSRGPEAVPSRP